MNSEEMKSEWRKARESMNLGNTGGLPFTSRRRTSLERLARRYRSFAALSVAAMPFGILLALRAPYIVPEVSPWLFVGFDVYFLVAAVMDYWLCSNISAIDCTEMSVEDVLRRSMLCRKRHLQFIGVLAPMAIVLLTFTAIAFKAETSAVVGMVCGALFGLAFGIKALIDFMRDYRDIME